MWTLLVGGLLILQCWAQDPAVSWTGYAVASCGHGTQITHLSATTVVPQSPTEIGGYPALWFGIEDANNINLLQPIVPAWGQCTDSSWCVFNEQFRWHGMQNWDGNSVTVQPGDSIYASLDLVKGSYVLTIKVTGSINTTLQDVRHPDVLEGLSFVNAYFVVEHCPNSCQAMPMNGITYSNIELYCNGTMISTPQWVAKLETPCCDMDVQISDPRTIAFAWNNQDSAINI